MLATTILGHAAWTVTFNEAEGHYSTAIGIRWQVYGSGPRLAWQWVTTVVLAVLLLSLAAGLLQPLKTRLSPTDILKPAGVLVAANLSGRMGALSSERDEYVLERLRFRDKNNWTREGCRHR